MVHPQAIKGSLELAGFVIIRQLSAIVLPAEVINQIAFRRHRGRWRTSDLCRLLISS